MQQEIEHWSKQAESVKNDGWFCIALPIKHCLYPHSSINLLPTNKLNNQRKSTSALHKAIFLLE